MQTLLDFGKFQRWFYVAWFEFVVKYRKTSLGPVWLLAGPILQISVLGFVFSNVNAIPSNIFVPHLAIGIVLWVLLGGLVTRSVTVYKRNRAQILQGSMTLIDISVVDVLAIFMQFLHQVIIVAFVLIMYQQPLTGYSFVSFLGLLIVLANGLWLSVAFGILGARYGDLQQVVMAIMRVAFLATPIIWMANPPGGGGRGEGLGAFLLLNPFYHFLEVVRAPILGTPIDQVTWIAVVAITICGFGFTGLLYKRYSSLVPLWV